MAEPKVTYAFYAGRGGTLEEDGFEAALPRARAAVRRRIWPNDPSEAPRAWRRAVCAAVDVDAAYGLGGGAVSLSSLSAGTVSMSFGGSGSGSSYEADLARAIDAELVGSGLLHMGLG